MSPDSHTDRALGHNSLRTRTRHKHLNLCM